MFGLLFEDAIILAVACLTTTGPLIELIEFGYLSIMELSYFSKMVLVVSMVVGRLEILIALSLFAYTSRRALK